MIGRLRGNRFQSAFPAGEPIRDAPWQFKAQV